MNQSLVSDMRAQDRTRQLNRVCALYFLFIFVAITNSACSWTTRTSYEDWQISTDTREVANVFRNYRSGHLLERAPGSVLEVYRTYDPNPLTSDDEVCTKIWVQVPPYALLQTPTELRNPVAFAKRCNCVWGNCREEDLLSGDVSLQFADRYGVRARLNLTFPSTTVRAGGLFSVGTPHFTSMRDDVEVQRIISEIHRQYRASGERKMRDKELH